MEPWQAITILLGAAGLVFTVIWSLAGKPEPLSPASLRRFGRFVRSSPARWRARRNRQRATKREHEERIKEEQLHRERTEKERLLKTTLRYAVLRLHAMERGNSRYTKTVWKGQKTLCKDAVFGIVEYMGYQLSPTGNGWDNVACTNYETDTIIFHFTKSRRRKRALQLYILVHPSPNLTETEYGWSELAGGSAIVLSMALTAADLTRLGWEFPDEWEGWEPKGIPGRSLPEHMTPEAIVYRRVRDWNPDSPFAGLKLPD